MSAEFGAATGKDRENSLMERNADSNCEANSVFGTGEGALSVEDEDEAELISIGETDDETPTSGLPGSTCEKLRERLYFRTS